MKPGTEYDLGALGDGFKILNWENKEVDGVELKPGVEYQFTISVKADQPADMGRIDLTTK